MEWLAAHFFDIILSLLTAFLLFCFRSVYKDLKEVKINKTKEIIQEEVQPIIKEIEHLHELIEGIGFDIEKLERQQRQDIAAIRVSYRFRLISLCKTYIRQGYITSDQFDQISEFYQVYKNIGGNGQAEEYYERVLELDIRDDVH